MSLTSPLLLGLVVVGAVVLPVVLIIVWGRGPGGIGGRLLRLVGILVCQLLAVGAIGLYANNQYGFYTSWGELAGQSDAAVGAVDLTNLVPADGSQGRVMTISVKCRGRRGWAPLGSRCWSGCRSSTTSCATGSPGTRR